MKKSDEEEFKRLKDELIDGTDSLVDKYNKIRNKPKCKVLNGLLDEFQTNYRELFKIYKSGNGIKEAKNYLEIGRLYIDIINSKLNQFNVRKSIKYAWFSIILGFASVILGIATIIKPDIFKIFFPREALADQPSKTECYCSPKDTIHLVDETILVLPDSLCSKK